MHSWGGKGFGIGALGIFSGYSVEGKTRFWCTVGEGKALAMELLEYSLATQWKVRPGSGAQWGRERLWHRSSWNILRLLSVEGKNMRGFVGFWILVNTADPDQTAP